MVTTHWSTRIEELDKYWRQCGLNNFRREINDLIEELITSKEQKILDVGCGSGITYDYLREDLKKQYVGVDYTQECLQLCKSEFPMGDFRLGDARTLPFSDETFYLVVCVGILMHNLEWEKILREMIRVSEKYVILNEAITTGKTHNLGIHDTETPAIKFNPEDLLRIMGEFGEAMYFESLDTKGREGKLGTFLLIKGEK